VLDEAWVLVANNAGDFLELAESAGLHPGLVFIELGSARTQREWLAAAWRSWSTACGGRLGPPAARASNVSACGCS
jgi:hypothetical protein